MVTVIDSKSVTIMGQVEGAAFPATVSVTTPNQQAIVAATCLSETTGVVTIIFSMVNRFNDGTYTATVTDAVGSSKGSFKITVQCELRKITAPVLNMLV